MATAVENPISNLLLWSNYKGHRHLQTYSQLSSYDFDISH